MIRNEAQAAIYEKLSDVLTPHSFKLKKSAESFVRTTPEGRQSIYVSLVDLEPYFEFSVVVAFRFESVERIAHQFAGVQDKYKNLTETAIVQLEHFTKGKLSEFSVSSREELDEAVRILSTVFREKILPVMEECKSLSSLEAHVNAEQGFNSAQPPYSLLISLILAHQANPIAFDALAEKVTSSITQLDASEKGQVTGLICFLRDPANQYARYPSI